MKLVLFLLIPMAAFYSCKNNTTVPSGKDQPGIQVIDEISSNVNNEAKEYKDTVVSPGSQVDSVADKSAEPVDNSHTIPVKKTEKKTTIPRPEPEIKKDKIEQVPVDDPIETEQKIKDKIQGKTLPRPQPKEQTEKIEQVPVGKTEDKRQKTQDVTEHEIFDALLQKYVNSDGKVNYAGFKSEIARLKEYLGILESTEVSGLKTKEQLAFWINAYNAYTIKLILDNYPLSSIMDLDGGKVWNRKWIKLDGRTLSLNNIENDIIRPTFKEPRIHFAVNCAAKSCPPLLNKAWTSANMESMFEKQTRSFINNPAYNEISTSRIRVSRIFEWYKTDFGPLIEYINRYSSTSINPGTTIEYLEYDWSLNQ